MGLAIGMKGVCLKGLCHSAQWSSLCVIFTNYQYLPILVIQLNGNSEITFKQYKSKLCDEKKSVKHNNKNKARSPEVLNDRIEGNGRRVLSRAL